MVTISPTFKFELEVETSPPDEGPSFAFGPPRSALESTIPYFEIQSLKNVPKFMPMANWIGEGDSSYLPQIIPSRRMAGDIDPAARIDLAADTLFSGSAHEADNVIDLAVNPTVRETLEATLTRRPDLVVRIRTIAEEMRRRFKAEPYIESAVYDSDDAPLTLTVESPISVDEFAGEYVAFIDFLVDRKWDYDPSIDTYVTLTPGDDE